AGGAGAGEDEASLGAVGLLQLVGGRQGLVAGQEGGLVLRRRPQGAPDLVEALRQARVAQGQQRGGGEGGQGAPRRPAPLHGVERGEGVPRPRRQGGDGVGLLGVCQGGIKV